MSAHPLPRLLVFSVGGGLCVGCASADLRAARRAVDALPASARCPPGMVLVEGQGRLGLEAERFAVVQTANRQSVVEPESECPAALLAKPDAVSCWVQTDLVDPVMPPRTVDVKPVCVDAFPFPGEGAPYTVDGMTAWDAFVLQKVLARGSLGGRRLCTATELQAATAGVRSNHPVVYGDRHDSRRCPVGRAIGHDPGCANPETGVHEYGAVHSHWVVADPDMVAAACDSPPCRAAGNRLLEPGMLLVLGGTGRLQTRQAPLTPHTWHDHGRPVPSGCDDMGHDDQPAICADPSGGWGRHDAALTEGEARWRALVRVARETGRMDRMLDTAVGGASCPGAPAQGGRTSPGG